MPGREEGEETEEAKESVETGISSNRAKDAQQPKKSKITEATSLHRSSSQSRNAHPSSLLTA
jgi:hypothetical protein